MTVRLLCLPHAGGGTSLYRDWAAALAPVADVVAVPLPGRERRIAEAPFTRMGPLADHLGSELLAETLPDRYVLFGHSMGALLAFELARRLRDAGHPPPLALVVSAHRAPHVPDPSDRVAHRLHDAELVAHLRELEGTPVAVLADPELRALVLPAIRADFAVCETYEFEPAQPLACPLVAYLPTDDELMAVEHVRAWEQHTTGPFELVRLRGGHFFLAADPRELLADLAGRLHDIAVAVP